MPPWFKVLVLLAALLQPAWTSSVRRLYHFPLFSSSRVVQLILELGITDIEIISLSYKAMKEEPYLSINPHGTAPAYEEDGLVLLESGAIMTYLLERHDVQHRLLPADLHQRARYHQFVHYATATLYSKAGGLYVHEWEFREGTAGAAKRKEEAIKTSRRWLEHNFVPFLQRELRGQLYLLGSRLSAADIAVGWEVMLLGKIGFLQNFPALQAYHDRLAEEPSFQATYPAGIHRWCIWPHEDPKCQALHEGLREDLLSADRVARRRSTEL